MGNQLYRVNLGSLDFGKLTLAEKRVLIEAEKELVVQEQAELSVLMPPAPSMHKLWFNNLVQIGYIAFFSLSFPIAPLWGVVMGFVQVNTMFWVFGASIQRAPSVEAESIGIWEDIIYVYSLLALIVNAFILMFSSKGIFELVRLDSADTWDVYTVTVALVIAENIIFVVKFLIAALIPDVPAWVKAERANQSKLKEFTLDSEIKKKVAEQRRKMLLDSNLLRNFAKEGLDKSGLRKSGVGRGKASAGSRNEGGMMAMFMDQIREKSEVKLPE